MGRAGATEFVGCLGQQSVCRAGAELVQSWCKEHVQSKCRAGAESKGRAGAESKGRARAELA